MIPERAERIPKIKLNAEKSLKFSEMFFAAAAGIITRAPVNSAPATLIPSATMTAIRRRKVKSIF